MATCPQCGASSRTDSTFVLERVVLAAPLASFSVAGAQMKVPARIRLRLMHAGCGWFVYGSIEGEDFVADPTDPRVRGRE